VKQAKEVSQGLLERLGPLALLAILEQPVLPVLLEEQAPLDTLEPLESKEEREA
jgi:hypothetical protein